MPKKEKNREKKLDQEWSSADDDKLFLKDMNPKTGHLSNLSTNKNGKEISVGKQISNYLKNMKLLEKSVVNLEKSIEKSEIIISRLKENKTVKKRYKGKSYSTTLEMIKAVKLYDEGRITYQDLLEVASWSRDPESTILISQMIAGAGKFRKGG